MTVKSLSSFNKNKSPATDLGFYINKPIFTNRVGKGEVGIEIECEGRRFPELVVIEGVAVWVGHTDGSLRGENMEYVLERPIPKTDVSAALYGLYSKLRELGTEIKDSNRTSVHVHLNMGGMKANQLCSIIALYGILEDVLVNWCGPHRVGNLFALRLSDSQWAVDAIPTAVATGNFNSFGDNVRYLAVNFAALQKFGSLEFRSLRGCDEPDTIIKWIEMLWKMKETALKLYANPEDIANRFSGLGAEAFLAEVIGRQAADEIIRYNNSIGENTNNLIWEGMRRMQATIYTLPWSKLMDEINRVAIPDPFAKGPTKKKSHLRPDWVENEGIDMIREVVRARPPRFEVRG